MENNFSKSDNFAQVGTICMCIFMLNRRYPPSSCHGVYVITGSEQNQAIQSIFYPSPLIIFSPC